MPPQSAGSYRTWRPWPRKRLSSPDTADTFSVLTAAAAERDPRLAQQAAEYVATLQRQAQTTGQVRLKPWPAYVVARAWMRSEIIRSQGEALGRLLATHATGTQQRSFVSYLHRDLASCRVQQCGGTLAAGTDPGLALWHPGGYYFTSGSQAGTWPGWWVERDGMILHLSGPEVSPLYFDCPLVGNFELTVDGYCSAAAEAAVQYGRLLFEPFGRGGKAHMLTIGERESSRAAGSEERPRPFQSTGDSRQPGESELPLQRSARV